MVWCLVALMMTHLLRSVKEFFAQTTPEKKKYSEMHRPKIVYMEDIYPKSKSSEKKDNIQTKTPLKKTDSIERCHSDCQHFKDDSIHS